MQDEVCRLQVETGKTMVFITHDLPEALRLGDRIAIMRDGKSSSSVPPRSSSDPRRTDYVGTSCATSRAATVLTLRWIMRDPEPGETAGPTLPVDTTVRQAFSVIAGSERPVCAVADGKVVGVVDRAAVLDAIAGEGED